MRRALVWTLSFLGAASSGGLSSVGSASGTVMHTHRAVHICLATNLTGLRYLGGGKAGVRYCSLAQSSNVATGRQVTANFVYQDFAISSEWLTIKRAFLG